MKNREIPELGFMYYFLRWMSGFCDTIDGLCVLFSLGFYNPGLSFKITCYSVKKSLKKRMKVK
jgi:hypothetical protein